MAYRRARSKQAMQKLVTLSEHTWDPADTFKAIQLTGSEGFDDECIVKRIRSTVQANNNATPEDAYEPMIWTIVQTQTERAPQESDMYDNNLVVATGIVSAGGGSRTYDHSITMRKLSGSSLFLCLQVINTPHGNDFTSTTITQVHYVEG